MGARIRLAFGLVASSALVSGCYLQQTSAASTLIPGSARPAVIVAIGPARLDFDEALTHLTVPASLRPKVPLASRHTLPALPKKANTVAKKAAAKASAVVVALPKVVVKAVVAAAPLPMLGSSAYRDLILSKIAFNWRALDFSIDFVGPRDGYLGLTSIGLKAAPHNRIAIYVRPDEPLDQVAYIAAYEIGHVVDVSRNTDADRVAWLKQRGNPNASWFTCNACTEDMVGAGDFSDVFAWYTTNHGFYVSRVAAAPSAAALAELTHFFAR